MAVNLRHRALEVLFNGHGLDVGPNLGTVALGLDVHPAPTDGYPSHMREPHSPDRRVHQGEAASPGSLHEGEGSLAVHAIQERLRLFAAERDWERFHSPKNLAMALAGEVGELLAHFQWLTEDESSRFSDADRAEVGAEIADIQIYLLRLVDVLELPLSEVVEAKLKSSAIKHPAAEVRGKAPKPRGSN